MKSSTQKCTLLRAYEEIITHEEIKNYLKLNDNIDKNFLSDVIKAVRETAEDFLSINIIKKEFKQVYYNYQGGRITLKQIPVLEIKSVSSGEYEFFDSDNSLIIKNVPFGEKISIEYAAGYDPKLLPLPLKIGMFMHIESIYEHGALIQSIPRASISFYSSYRDRNIFL